MSQWLFCFYFFNYLLVTTLTNFLVFCLQDTRTQMVFSVPLNAVKIYVCVIPGLERFPAQCELA